MNFGLKQRDIEHLSEAFRQFPEIDQVLIFGSRAKGNSKSGSDIDLALKGDGITDQIVTRLHSFLDELPLPYFFDLVDYKSIQNNDLREHIDRVGQVLFKKR